MSASGPGEDPDDDTDAGRNHDGEAVEPPNRPFVGPGPGRSAPDEPRTDSDDASDADHDRDEDEEGDTREEGHTRGRALLCQISIVFCRNHRRGSCERFFSLPIGPLNMPEQVADDALEALRNEFEDVDKSAVELRAEARETMLELAGRTDSSQ